MFPYHSDDKPLEGVAFLILIAIVPSAIIVMMNFWPDDFQALRASAFDYLRGGPLPPQKDPLTEYSSTTIRAFPSPVPLALQVPRGLGAETLEEFRACLRESARSGFDKLCMFSGRVSGEVPRNEYEKRLQDSQVAVQKKAIEQELKWYLKQCEVAMLKGGPNAPSSCGMSWSPSQ
jgi:hypothetical protein